MRYRRPRNPRSRCPATSGCWASIGCCAATPRRWPDVAKVLAGGLADMAFSGSAVQRELRRDDEGQVAWQEAQDRQRQSGRWLRTVPAGLLHELVSGNQGRDLHLHVVLGDCTRCSGRSARRAGTGPRSSSGRRTRSRWGGRTTSGSTNRSSTGGRKVRITSGAARGTRATCGSSRSPSSTISIQR